MVDFFIQGGGFMWPILIALLFGLAIIGERAYSLINSSSNTDQFFDDVKTLYDDSGKEQAIEFCENTPGPVASIFYAGLSKMEKTKEEIEKAVQNAGGLEMAFLEKNMIWINSVITIAPMLGFTGTVVGMIKAFEDIKMANDISPAVVAGGISQALLTTAFGLIVAMIMQVAQNFFVSMIDKLILDMEEQSIKIVEYLHNSIK
jgi:biopolymer transport protein ExbB